MKTRIIERIEAAETIVIHRHQSPDPDALGAQGGLQAVLEENYPDKAIWMTGESEPSLSFLTEMDEVSNEVYEGALVFVLDTANTERIDDQRYQHGAEVIKIDHHPEVESYGDISWVDSTKSSTCEMLTNFVQHGQAERGWQVPVEAARLLYAGIVGDTGRFRFDNVTPETMQAAAFLLKYPIDTTAMFTKFYESPERIIRFKGEVLLHFQLTAEGAGYGVITQEQMQSWGITLNESSAVVNAVADIEGIQAWAFFVENEDGTYRVRLRSKGPVINDLAAEHNGGGHPMASGAKAASKAETEEIFQKLKMKCEALRAET
ncbi:phosphoesterase RecJ-like protein [Salsuginibacillus halophilus]|uniref:Phosphoesterase RecJ-like protein n=1 Tax=Salsuginibacillus halophilus TaxID=517424 RepID=A0A2P8HCW9_9BACI|nr:bifunctional oligoribonuclease/PAP phosphatase NrnA [Salsuginibacillus halophilus]PSL44085.1 phosphoesterase RecJ-like protein [Salsuginibacillus halophilus]